MLCLVLDTLYHCLHYLLFFFLMIRRPPRSTRTDTLFPYTTLFRSSTLRPYVFASATIKSTTFWPGKLSPFFSLPPLWASSVSTDPIILGSYQRSGVLRLIAQHELLLFVGKQVSEREMLWRTPLEQNGGALAFIVPKRRCKLTVVNKICQFGAEGTGDLGRISEPLDLPRFEPRMALEV